MIVLPGAWLQIQLPSPVTATSYNLFSRTDNPLYGWTLLGSLDGSVWNIVDARSSTIFATANSFINFTVPMPASYSYYRLVTTNSSTNMVIIQGFDIQAVNGAIYPPGLLSSPTADGYTISNSNDGYSNGGGMTNWSYLTVNTPSNIPGGVPVFIVGSWSSGVYIGTNTT